MRPDCKCHAAPMRWNADKRYRGGGYWRCTVRINTRRRERRLNDPEWRERQNETRRRYEDDPLWRNAERMRKNAAHRARMLAARRKEIPKNPRLAAFLVSVRTRRTSG